MCPAPPTAPPGLAPPPHPRGAAPAFSEPGASSNRPSLGSLTVTASARPQRSCLWSETRRPCPHAAPSTAAALGRPPAPVRSAHGAGLWGGACPRAHDLGRPWRTEGAGGRTAAPAGGRPHRAHGPRPHGTVGRTWPPSRPLGNAHDAGSGRLLQMLTPAACRTSRRDGGSAPGDRSVWPLNAPRSGRVRRGRLALREREPWGAGVGMRHRPSLPAQR